jgi:hypothetical protein
MVKGEVLVDSRRQSFQADREGRSFLLSDLRVKIGYPAGSRFTAKPQMRKLKGGGGWPY